MPQNSEPKPQQPLSRLLEESKKKAATSVNTAAAIPTTHSLLDPNQNSVFPLEEIYLLDQLPFHACV